MSILIAIVLALAGGATAITHVEYQTYEDSSARLTLEYRAPRCPYPQDEPCYVIVKIDNEDGVWDVDEGP